MLLVGVFAVFVSGHCYVSWEINRFLKSFPVANIKIAGFSKLKTRVSLHVLKWNMLWGWKLVQRFLFDLSSTKFKSEFVKPRFFDFAIWWHNHCENHQLSILYGYNPEDKRPLILNNWKLLFYSPGEETHFYPEIRTENPEQKTPMETSLRAERATLCK